MKRIYYLLAFIAIAFSACNPLDSTYKQLGSLPTPTAPATAVTITLTAADYGLLPSADYAKTSLSYKTKADAAVSIPAILAAKYPTYGEKSSATVTYALTPVQSVRPPDTLNADVAITLNTTPTNDYIFPGNTFSDLSATAVLNYLAYKYPTPAANQLVVLTYLYFESGKTASSGTLTTDSFLYLNGTWTKIYRISNAQYALTNNGLNNWFVANDAANLVSYFNTFLKADPTVMLTAKFGDIKYISYRYLTTYQRVLGLTFDGTNWVNTSTPLTLSFVKTNGVWVADNTVTYKLTTADYTSINTSALMANINIATARANVASFGDFNIQTPLSATTGWNDADINSVIAVILGVDFPTAVANQKFNVTYLAYNGATISVVKTFVFNGTTFVYTP